MYGLWGDDADLRRLEDGVYDDGGALFDHGYGLGTHIHELRLAGNELRLAGLQPSEGCLIIDRNVIIVYLKYIPDKCGESTFCFLTNLSCHIFLSCHFHVLVFGLGFGIGLAWSTLALRSKASVNFVMFETVVKKLCSNTSTIDFGRLLGSPERSRDKRRSLAVTSATLLSFANF